MSREHVNIPTYEELWARVMLADDGACEGAAWDRRPCRHCEGVLEVLRGGHIYCPECGHINALGHRCSDWSCFGKDGHDEPHCQFVGEPHDGPPTTSNTSNPTPFTWRAS